MLRAPSERRYVVRLAIFMALYAALLYPVNWALHHGRAPSGYWLYAAAVLPAIPVLGAIWAMLRFLSEEEDEYKRFVRVQNFIWATGLSIAIMTVWGFLEDLAHIPPLPAMYPFLIFVVCVGLVQGVAEMVRR